MAKYVISVVTNDLNDNPSSGHHLVWKPASHLAEGESGDLLIPNWFLWNV